MTPRTIDRFFRTLALEFKESAAILVTGAAAGSLWGHIRPSQDIDFEIRLAGNNSAGWERFRSAINRTVQQTGIQANYAENIDRWGSITLLNYRRHTAPHRRFNTLSIRLLEPAYWSIGKLARYFALDSDDVVRVFRRTRVSAALAIRVWGKALSASQQSTAIPQFQSQTEHFLRTHGRTIWGRTFDAEAAIRRFHRAAGLDAKAHPVKRIRPLIPARQ